MKKLILLFLLLLIPLVSAESFKQGENISFIQLIRVNGFPSDSITANITITGPDDTLLIGYTPMTYNSANKTFNFTFTQTKELGTYQRCITASDGTLNDTTCFAFDITPSGFQRINEGESIQLIGGSLLMVFIGVLFFIMFLRMESIAPKIAFLSGSVIVLFMAVLFITVTLQQNLAGYTNITGAFETFVTVMKTLMTISLVGFVLFGVLFVGLAMWKGVRRRRGIDDD